MSECMEAALWDFPPASTVGTKLAVNVPEITGIWKNLKWLTERSEGLMFVVSCSLPWGHKCLLLIHYHFWVNIPSALVRIASICETPDSHSSFNFSTNWSVNVHTSMPKNGRHDQPVYGILHDHHLVLVPGPLFPLPMRQRLAISCTFCRQLQLTDTKKCFTFCFFLRVTLTPSTDTMMPTFFFLMFFALNSYWKQSKMMTLELSRRQGCVLNCLPNWRLPRLLPGWTQLALFIICDLPT